MLHCRRGSCSWLGTSDRSLVSLVIGVLFSQSVMCHCFQHISCTYVVVESVAVPVPSLKQLGLAAVCLGPGIAVSDRRVHVEDADGKSQEDDCTSLSDDRVLAETKTANTSGDEIICLAKSDDGEVECWEVVVQEELSLHEEEGQPVERPTKDASANLVIEALERNVVVVLVTTLPSEHGKTLEGQVQGDGNRSTKSRGFRSGKFGGDPCPRS